MQQPRHLKKLQLGIALHRLLLLLLLLLLVLSSSASGVLSSRVVTLGSIEIYSSHEWFDKPTVYFHCKGENKTTLPDVKKINILYSFKGEESWQPLTELPDKKCKRCGLYETDKITRDDVYDEWELCPDDFVDGKYTHFKDNEVNATFICTQCTGSIGSSQTSNTTIDSKHKKMKVSLVIVVCVLSSIIAVAGLVAVYKYWQKKKREHDQARFLKLFEEGDDIEDELGLGHVI